METKGSPAHSSMTAVTGEPSSYIGPKPWSSAISTAIRLTVPGWWARRARLVEPSSNASYLLPPNSSTLTAHPTHLTHTTLHHHQPRTRHCRIAEDSGTRDVYRARDPGKMAAPRSHLSEDGSDSSSSDEERERLKEAAWEPPGERSRVSTSAVNLHGRGSRVYVREDGLWGQGEHGFASPSHSLADVW